MLKFLVHDDAIKPADWRLCNAHLLGADDMGVRAAITYRDGLICCDKKTMGPAALALKFPLEGLGELTLQTSLLPEREQPYLLTVELARHRLMKIIAKMEDWGLFELADDVPAMRRINLAKQKFIEALCQRNDAAKADKLARESLLAAVDASEELALNHAEMLLGQRRETRQLPKNGFGVGIGLRQTGDSSLVQLLTQFDFVRLPTPWRLLEPEEQEYDWELVDSWAEWAYRNKMPIVAGPIVSFTPSVVPDWLYIWEHDYDTIRDLLYEHIERVVTRYKNAVSLWNVISGVHVNEHFTFNFDQLMDLSRMAIMLAKQIQPNGRTLIEITHPFGEYYASNQRAIAPMMYAEMVLQSGIPFDGFGLKLLMGRSADGQYTRDLMQVSALLDRFSGLGKPLYITAVGVPSEPAAPPFAAADDESGMIHSAGYWRKPWSASVQGSWLEAFYNLAMARPYVESIAWHNLVDHAEDELPHSGLADAKTQPKKAYRRLVTFRKSLSDARGASNAITNPPAPAAG